MLKRRERLGKILLNHGVVTSSQIEEALAYKKSRGLRIGKAMLELDFLTEQELVDALCEQFGLDRVNVSDIVLDELLLDRFDEDYIRKGLFLPLSMDDSVLYIIAEDPLNIVLIDELESRFSVEVRLGLVGDSEIRKLISRYLDSAESLLEDLVVDTEGVDTDDSEFNVELNSSSAPIIKLVNSVLRDAVILGASDIHISVNNKDIDVRFRMDGILHEVNRFPKEISSAVIARIKMMADLDITEKRLPQDGSIRIKIEGRSVDLRVSTLPAIHGEKVVVRVLEKNDSIMHLAGLGFSDSNYKTFSDMINRPVGILLVTGPTGSGKSSTLYAAINEINNVDKNIITVEDPVEFKLSGITQVNVNSKIGLDFSTGLRSILRQDPDVILVGEIRDRETADISIRASNTGHLVFSTLHTNSAVSAVTRLVDMGIEGYMVASNVVGVLNQRLVRKVCNHCKESYVCSGTSSDKTFFGLGDEDVTLYRGIGCSHCNGTGFKGRVPLHELLVISDDVSRSIVRGDSIRDIEELAVREGFKTLKMDGLAKSLSGVTTLDEVRRFVT